MTQVRSRDRHRVPRRAEDRDEDVLRLRATSSAASRTRRSVRSAWACPARCRCRTQAAIEHMIARGAGVRRRDSRVFEVRPQELLLSRHAQGLSDLAVRHAAHAGRRRCKYWLEDGTMKECRLTRIHLEEDTGKSTHAGSGDGRIAGSYVLAGRFQSRRRAADGMRLGAGDAQRARRRSRILKRCAARCCSSASATSRWRKARCAAMPTSRFARPARNELGTKTEIKNMNSFRSVQRAIESEIERQIALVEVGRPHRARDARLGRSSRA